MILSQCLWPWGFEKGCQLHLLLDNSPISAVCRAMSSKSLFAQLIIVPTQANETLWWDILWIEPYPFIWSVNLRPGHRYIILSQLTVCPKLFYRVMTCVLQVICLSVTARVMCFYTTVVGRILPK